MKLIYVAGKHTADTHSGIGDNIRKAETLSIKLFNKNWSVFTPHKNTAHYEIYDAVSHLDFDFWMKVDIEVLSRCDAIIMLKNWQNSRGSKVEHEYAQKHNIRIFYEEDGIPEPEMVKDKIQV